MSLTTTRPRDPSHLRNVQEHGLRAQVIKGHGVLDFCVRANER